MTLAATIGFLLVSFMFLAILIKLFHHIWVALVVQPECRDGRDFWDEDDSLAPEITADTLTDMGTHHIPVELIDPEVRYEA